MSWFNRQHKEPIHQHCYEVMKEIPKYCAPHTVWKDHVNNIVRKYPESWDLYVYFKCSTCGHVKFDELEDVDKRYIDSLNKKQ